LGRWECERAAKPRTAFNGKKKGNAVAATRVCSRNRGRGGGGPLTVSAKKVTKKGEKKTETQTQGRPSRKRTSRTPRKKRKSTSACDFCEDVSENTVPGDWGPIQTTGKTTLKTGKDALEGRKRGGLRLFGALKKKGGTGSTGKGMEAESTSIKIASILRGIETRRIRR